MTASDLIGLSKTARCDWIALGLIAGVGPVTFARLVATFGSPTNVLAAPLRELAAHVGVSVALAIHQGADPAQLTQVLDWANRPGHTLLTLAESSYPRLLREIAAPPPTLYVLGRAALVDTGGIAIVGSRNASAQGLSDTAEFARALCDQGITIVSGLALGIDAAAHRAALAAGGKTVAVLGTGIDVVYPRSNRALFDALAVDGAIISEFALGTPPAAANFPQRNRLISGLTHGCLVIEAAIHSGSLITARLAAEQGREVFARPGSIHATLTKGCHALIKEGAKLVETSADIVEELGLGYVPHHAPVPAPPPSSAPAPQSPSALAITAAITPAITPDALSLALGFDPVDPDTLCMRLGLTPDLVSAMLLTLEIDGVVAALPGGRYQRLK